MLRRMRWYLWVLAGIFLAYLVVSIYFMEHFFPGTTVNGEGADLLTVREANSLILAQAEGYELKLLERGGILSVCIYSGKDTGWEERDAVLPWLRGLDPRKYLVLTTEYYNRPNHPPIPAFIIKM